MAQATAVQTKIAMIAAIRFNMLGCASTLSARPQPTSPGWDCQVLFIVKYKQVRGSALLHAGTDFGPSSLLPTPIALPRAVIPSEARNLSSLLFAPLRRIGTCRGTPSCDRLT